MKRLFEIFRLEMLSIVRSKTLLMLSVVSVAWVVVFPYLAKGDGTAAGARELQLHYSLGGVFALLVVSLLASATGTLASERSARRLQLTLVRPVRYAVVAWGKILAHVAAGAIVLTLSAVTLLLSVKDAPVCNHALSPVLPTPQEEARGMYKVFMDSPDTPPAVKKAGKAAVLRILEQRAIDHYQTIPTNSTAEWKFDASALSRESDLSVRIRFTNSMEMRQDVFGAIRFGNLSAAVSNMTQAVLTIPLVGGQGASRDEGEGGTRILTFSNNGKHGLMLRPRKDIHLLVPADAFWLNLLRTCLELLAVLSVIIAFGVFLSASLGRPVAIFVAFVTLILSEMSPSVVEQYPSEIGADFADRIGLALTRFAAELTHPISALSPLEKLSKDECVESDEVTKVLVLDALAVPLLLALLSGLVMPRKQDEI